MQASHLPEASVILPDTVMATNKEVRSTQFTGERKEKAVTKSDMSIICKIYSTKSQIFNFWAYCTITEGWDDCEKIQWCVEHIRFHSYDISLLSIMFLRNQFWPMYLITYNYYNGLMTSLEHLSCFNETEHFKACYACHSLSGRSDLPYRCNTSLNCVSHWMVAESVYGYVLCTLPEWSVNFSIVGGDIIM